MTNFNFEYKGTFLRYKDSNGNLLDLNGSQVDTDLEDRTEQNETDIAALQQYFDSISVKENASGAVASFADGADNVPVKSLVVNIEPIQEGTGDPSPENIRPISGRTEVNIWRDAEHDTSGDPVLTIQLGQTVYGGTVDTVSGVLTVDTATVDISAVEDTSLYAGANSVAIRVPLRPASASAESASQTHGAIASCGTEQAAYYGVNRTGDASTASWHGQFAIGTTVSQALIYDADTTLTKETFLQKYAGAQICYPLAQPITITLTPEQLTTLLGTNNIWSDSGNVSVNYIADTKLYIDSAIAASADSAESVNANNREEVKETINEIEKPDVIEEKEVINDNIEEEKEI